VEWRDDGFVLAVRPHGESGAIVEAFTARHGRHAGVVRGGAGRRLSPVLQIGAQLDLVWKARLPEHAGSYTVEPVRSRAGALMGDRLGLSGLAAVCALLARGLPERQPLPAFYGQSVQVLDLLAATPAWPLAYLRWEVALLSELGARLDLSSCAVTGATEGLVFVSPRTGRAVTADGAAGYADRLLPLPPCLLGQGEAPNGEIALALRTTGHFLTAALPAGAVRAGLPPERQRLIDLLERYSTA
jgi:DNA repair protein RecO (recombination protein O)